MTTDHFRQFVWQVLGLEGVTGVNGSEDRVVVFVETERDARRLAGLCFAPPGRTPVPAALRVTGRLWSVASSGSGAPPSGSLSVQG